ncbi:hypothetical protein VTK73DRAFT_2560 [Phialemonium thermophilum]|uniref:polynucleotide adenylyltransferase n=1 Tax=Phialemonium thermophilum TaxID=223376 RepID=A0ABR3X4E6_9PEZI
MEGEDVAGSDLNQRLRKMILKNASGGGSDGTGNMPPAVWPPPAAPVGSPTSQQSSETPPAHPQASPRGGRRRPNQAQRRQMSAQLTIPVDHRPPPLPSMRPYAGHNTRPNYHPPPDGVAGTQRPHSATFRPPPGYHLPGSPPSTRSFPSQPRHQQSLSYNGPTSHGPDIYGWRSVESQRQRELYSPAHSATSPKSPGNTHLPSHHSARPYNVRPEVIQAQADMLEGLCHAVIANAEIEMSEIAEKEAFRAKIEQICRAAITQYEREHNGRLDFPPESVQLRCFGSLSSGFATKASDMDLGLLSPFSHLQPDAPGSPIPRIVEKAFLDVGLGARLLTRTRVPIIKVCEKPPQKLHLDLLEERLKWERGFAEDLDAADDGQHEELAADLSEEAVPTGEKKQQGDDKRDDDATPEGGRMEEEKLLSLKQTANKSLASYYGVAKGVLRKLGGRDITNSNISSLRPEDFRILNDVSLAFIQGLADEDLKRRLTSYSSLSPVNLKSQSHKRSLLGVYFQAEGEMMAMMWSHRPLPERDVVQERQSQRWVHMWQDLQNKSTSGLDPLGYNKELLLAFQQLQKIPSIQVMLLEQGQFESAAAYHSRAAKLMVELGGHDQPSTENRVLPVIINHYISGIHNGDIRRQVKQFAESEGTTTLAAIGRRHKSLQLAYEFEKALEKGLYDGPEKADVQTYIDLLRGPMTRRIAPGGNPADFYVPTTPEILPLVSKMRQQPDPSRLAPNQPRDPYRDRLEFPKTGAGVQCDINFSAHLALHNTLLLRCYSHTDPRVRPLVLFVKHWAKVRGINSPYRGTLSSYGYVLMMLHYLVNIAQPFVCPNLQELAPRPDPNLSPQQIERTTVCKGMNVQFWRDEAEIQRLARDNVLTQNRESVGQLLRGFFEYYAQNGAMTTVPGRGFDWGRDVLSLRTHGGLLTKQAKGWTGAKTVVEVGAIAAPPGSGSSQPSDQHEKPPSSAPDVSRQPAPEQLPSPFSSAPAQGPTTTREIKEVRYRYLFAIEDPFELDHNVARTVTHNGIVAIRDEFRRAWRIIRNAGRGEPQEDLLEDVAAAGLEKEKAEFAALIDELHGRGSGDNLAT